MAQAASSMVKNNPHGHSYLGGTTYFWFRNGTKVIFMEEVLPRRRCQNSGQIFCRYNHLNDLKHLSLCLLLPTCCQYRHLRDCHRKGRSLAFGFIVSPEIWETARYTKSRLTSAQAANSFEDTRDLPHKEARHLPH